MSTVTLIGHLIAMTSKTAPDGPADAVLKDRAGLGKPNKDPDLAPLSYVDLAFSTSKLNRRAEIRSDPVEVKRAAADPNARWLVFEADQIWLAQAEGATENRVGGKKTTKDRLLLTRSELISADVEPSSEIFLGNIEDMPCFAIKAQAMRTGGLFGAQDAMQVGRPGGAHGGSAPERVPEKLPISLKDDFSDKNALKTNRIEHLHDSTSRGNVLETLNLRTLAEQQRVSPEELGIAATARALLAWHDRHGFCANCGSQTALTDAGWRRHCPACETSHFPRTDPVVIMLVSDGGRCLLGRSPHFKPFMYSCLAGFMEPGETIEDAVAREVFEEAGLQIANVRYQLSQPWPFPMSLMIGCAARATSFDISLRDSELEDARWFSRSEVVELLNNSHQICVAPPSLAIAHHLMFNWVQSF